MYKILVVEDEPTALKHVCMILEKKCPQFEVIATAQNGQEALEQMEKCVPDVLVSDVRMPVMDGILLVSKVKAMYPDVLSVIVSGYSEFEYAKGALQSGVCDYLLKPLAPADMKGLMDRLACMLGTLYYEKRMEIIKNLCNGTMSEKKPQLYRYFPQGKYYAAIFRKNGIPKRFSRKTGVEIFSMEEERLYIYGRDEMEELYLIPEELLFQGKFVDMAERIFTRGQQEASYLTSIICEESFELEDFSGIVKKLYRKLDESVVIGVSQIVYLNRTDIKEVKQNNEKPGEAAYLEQVEYSIRYKENTKILEDVEKLLRVPDIQKCSQIYVESTVRYVFRLLKNAYPSDTNYTDLEFMIDDAFYYASNMQELTESILTIVQQCIPKLGEENINDKEQLLQTILSYINDHLQQPLPLGSICKKFGVSQTSLSRMFRLYEETSFGNYLTSVRINKAKQMMKQNPDAYIRDIAVRCGYADQFYFSRIFRSVAGMCPKEYMERNR